MLGGEAGWAQLGGKPEWAGRRGGAGRARPGLSAEVGRAWQKKGNGGRKLLLRACGGPCSARWGLRWLAGALAGSPYRHLLSAASGGGRRGGIRHRIICCAQVEAARAFGAQQVLYTFNPAPGSPSEEGTVFAESGAMNVFFLLEKVCYAARAERAAVGGCALHVLPRPPSHHAQLGRAGGGGTRPEAGQKFFATT